MSASSQKVRITRAVLAACVATLLAVAALATLPAQALADDEILPAPATVKAKATKKCTVEVSWSSVPNADGYTVYWSRYKDKGYEVVGETSSYDTSFTHDKAVAGAKNYYKVAVYGTVYDTVYNDYYDYYEDYSYEAESDLSEAACATVGSTFKNSFVKFTIPKYWRGKVCIEEKTVDKNLKYVSILDSNTGIAIASAEWFRRGNDLGGGDVVSHPVKTLKRGKGTIEVWVRSWATSLYYSKYSYDGGNPTIPSNDYESERQLTNAETNRLIKLQTGGKLNYAKVKKVPESKMSKYWRVSDKYVAKNLKVKAVTASAHASASAKPALAKSTNSKACAAYKKLLSKKILKWSYSTINPDTLKFACQDINKDGIKDLVLYNDNATTADGYYQIYTYAKGKLKHIGTYYSVRVYRNKNFFVNDSERMGYGHFIYYRLGKNGKVKELASYDYETMYEPETYDKVVMKQNIPFYYYGCKVNGKRVSYKTCMSKIKKLEKGAKSTLKYHKNTAANRAKYIK